MLHLSVVARSAIRPSRKNRVTCPFCNSAIHSRNPGENTPLGCCSFRENTVTASVLLLDATVSSRYPREKHSARRRRSPGNRPFRESTRRCANRLFPQENVLESLVHVTCSAPPLDLPVPSRTSHTNAPISKKSKNDPSAPIGSFTPGREVIFCSRKDLKKKKMFIFS